MMRALVSFSLRSRYLVVAAAIAVAALAARGLRDVPLDVFPEFAPPLVEIQTEAPGLSAPEVEALISVPIENAVAGTAWLQTLRSKSVPGLSSVVLLFERDADIMRARQLVQERLTLVSGQLPDVSRPPVMLSPLSATSRAMKIGLSSKRLSLIELSTLARWTIRPHLMSVPGVANVAIWGQRDRQLQVQVDPERLRANGVTLDQVMAAAGDATRPAAGGFIDTPNQRFGIRHVSPIRDASDLAKVPVKHLAGATLRLGDVAQVVEDHQPMIGDGVINDDLGILLIVEKQPWGNTLEVTHKVEQALAALAPGLAGVEVDSTIFRPATFIEQSVDNLTGAMWVGCLLVILVLSAFLYEWRSAIISVIAIPLSLLTALFVMVERGTTLNTMVLAGLVIALGEVVDDAIIDVENIVRRLRQAREAGEAPRLMPLILGASLEVRSAIVYATLIVVLALLPVFFLEGLSGAFFRPLAASYVLAVLASMLVAMTVTPALSMILLPNAPLQRRKSPLQSRLQSAYGKLLPTVLGRPGRSIIAVLLMTAAGVGVFPFLGESLLPAFKERDFLMHWVEKPGTSLQAMDRITIAAGRELRGIDGVRNFGAHVGRAEVADEVVGINFTELWISLDPDAPYLPTVRKVQEVVDGYPGLYRDLLTYLQERIKEVLSGSSSGMVVRIFGPELPILRSKAAEVGAALSSIDGVVDLKVEPQVELAQVEVRLDLAAAERFGLSPGTVQRAANTLVSGSKVGEVFEDQKVFDVVVWSEPRVRDSLSDLSELLIETPSGNPVRLGDVASIRLVPAPNVVKRESVSRRIDVGCNVSGRDLGAVAREIEAKLAEIDFPNGYHPELLGEYAERRAASQRLTWLTAVALLGMFLLLQTSFGSFRLALLAFSTLPAALVGGLLGAAVGGGVISLGSVIGFVTVLGIAARNGIMLVSHYQHLQREEDVPFGHALAVRGAKERLAPILMTALTTGLALVPLAITGDLPGHEIEHPMAVVILGGLVTSTLLNLLVVPALYLRFGTPEMG